MWTDRAAGAAVVAALFFFVGCGDAAPEPDAAAGDAGRHAGPATAPSSHVPGGGSETHFDPLADVDLSSLSPPVRRALEERRAPLLDALRRGAGSDAEVIGGLGMLYLAARLEIAAEGALSLAHRSAPGDARWPFLLGHLHRTHGRLDRAREWYAEARDAAPGDPARHVWLGNVLIALGDLEAAEISLRRAVELDPRSASALYGLGRIALARERHDEAARRIEDAVALQPGATAMHYPLGLAYRGLGRAEDARRAMNRRGRVEPYPRDPLLAEVESLLPNPQRDNQRGMDALTAGRLEEAARAFRAALAVDPENPVYRLNLGNALARMGETVPARREFEKAHRLAPGDARALVNLGTLAAQDSRTAEAITLYERAVSADPALGEARLSLAAELFRAGRPADALAHFATMIEIDPSEEQARLGYAMSLALTGRHAEAQRACEEGISHLGGSQKLDHVLARLLSASRDEDVRDGHRALELARRVHAAEPSPDSAETLAMALAESGRFGEAAEHQRAVIDAADRAGRPALASALRETLALYESGRPCRTPWRVE